MRIMSFLRTMKIVGIQPFLPRFLQKEKKGVLTLSSLFQQEVPTFLNILSPHLHRIRPVCFFLLILQVPLRTQS